MGHAIRVQESASTSVGSGDPPSSAATGGMQPLSVLYEAVEQFPTRDLGHGEGRGEAVRVDRPLGAARSFVRKTGVVASQWSEPRRLL
jgi:hypothetical protein